MRNLKRALSDLDITAVRGLMGRIEIQLGPGTSREEAGERVRRTFGDSPAPDLKGFALEVLQPASWWNEGIPEIK